MAHEFLILRENTRCFLCLWELIAIIMSIYLNLCYYRDEGTFSIEQTIH